MHIPKFCNWIAEHNTDRQCGYDQNTECLLCVFKTDAALYWERVRPRIENSHDKNFKDILKRMPSIAEFPRWEFHNVKTMADCNEFMDWLVNSGFPWQGQMAFEEGEEEERGYW